MNDSDSEDDDPCTLQDLPLEMLDWILMKTLYFSEFNWVQTKQYISNDALLRFLVRLQTVSSVWRIRLNCNWFNVMFKLQRKNIEGTLSACPVLVKRSEWFARDPTNSASLSEPVSMVIIHNTVEPDECFDERSCMRAVQFIQNYHMYEKGWADTAYNFLIGEDGRVYEGRGWKVHGAHTLGYNDTSIGIAFVGFFAARAPRDVALRAAQQLIRLGVREGHIAANYALHCHRDLRRPDSRSPGQYLYDIVRSWPNYKSIDE